VNGLDLRFLHPGLVHLLWAVIALVALLGWLELRGRDVLGRFVSALMQRRLAFRPTAGRIALRMGLLGGALALAVVALMRPQTRGTTETISSRARADVMFVLDVSKSMLAEDASPNRLERAKAEIDEMLDELPDHRFGLTAFAGRAVELCPLTSDRAFFRMVLRETDTGSVSRGGTKIGEALRTAVRAFRAGVGAKLVVLITDGEDQDSSPLEAAEEAAKAGVRVIAIGFGSEQGSPVFVTDPATGARSAVVDRATGQPVISRLDGDLLRRIALSTRGAYVPAGTSAIDLDAIVTADIQPIVRQQADAMVRTVPAERYPWAVLGALLCLFGSVWAGSSAPPPTSPSAAPAGARGEGGEA
jgi:Ca-activated chloride channel family protein